MAGSTKKMFILPLAMVAWFIIVFLIAYIMALTYGTILFFIPNISDIGAHIPESCVFSLMMNIGSLLLMITAYLRYVHVNETIKSNNGNRVFAYVNLASFFGCILAAIGFTATGNFLITQWFLPHALGLGSGLFLGSVYTVIQAVLCFLLKPNLGPTWMTFARMGVSGVCFFFCIIALGAGTASYSAQEGEDLTKWNPDSPGYFAHVICAMAEFGTLILLLVFALSFAYDFKDVEFSEPEIEIEELPSRTPAPET